MSGPRTICRGEPKTSSGFALELRVVRIARRIVRHRDEIAEVDVQMIIGEATILANRPDPRTGQRLARDVGVALDAITRIEILVADAIDVHCRRPAVRRRVTRQLVLRRAIAAVGGDPHGLSDGLPKAFEKRSRQHDGARYVARKEAKRRRLTDIRMDEFPHVEVRRELMFQRGVP